MGFQNLHYTLKIVSKILGGCGFFFFSPRAGSGLFSWTLIGLLTILDEEPLARMLYSISLSPNIVTLVWKGTLQTNTSLPALDFDLKKI